jgi:hypothetical protein
MEEELGFQKDIHYHSELLNNSFTTHYSNLVKLRDGVPDIHLCQSQQNPKEGELANLC